MQICDIDKKDGKMDIWVYAYTDSDDIRYSALYQYSKGKIKRIWNLTEDYNSDNKAYARRCGFIVDTDGKGNFTIAIDRTVNNGFLTGNHIDRVKFNLKRGKVTQVTKHTYYFYKAYNLAGGKGKWFITKRQMVFYKDHNTVGGNVTVKKGSKCVPKKMYVTSDNHVYVMYKFADGKKLWLCSEDYNDFDNLPFKNMGFAD